MKRLRFISLFAASLVATLCVVWSAGALYYDLPWPSLRGAAAGLYLLGLIMAVFRLRNAWPQIGISLASFALILAWWLTLQPRNDRPWQPDVSQTAWAEVNGDEVTLHNVRNCDYRSETDFTARWETRTVDLGKLTGIDLAITYWGSDLMAHPIASFQFEDAPPVCISIETRKEIGESYSAIGGFYRQYELIYVVADERDVIRVRSNFRKGEDVYLYRTTSPPAEARARFLEYLASIHELHVRPRWYNAATTNCTTSIRTQRAAGRRIPWDWRMLINGYADRMLFDQGAFATDGLPFLELRSQALMNPAAPSAACARDFSRLIRADRAGFRDAVGP